MFNEAQIQLTAGSKIAKLSAYQEPLPCNYNNAIILFHIGPVFTGGFVASQSCSHYEWKQSAGLEIGGFSGLTGLAHQVDSNSPSKVFSSSSSKSKLARRPKDSFKPADRQRSRQYHDIF
jgi:hypothetical protein